MSSFSEIMNQIHRVIKNLKNKIIWNTQVKIFCFLIHIHTSTQRKDSEEKLKFYKFEGLDTAPLESKAHGSKYWPVVPKENMLSWTGKWKMTCQGVFIYGGLIKTVSQENNTNCPWNLQLPPYREITYIMEDKERGSQWTHSSLKLSMWGQWSENSSRE